MRWLTLGTGLFLLLAFSLRTVWRTPPAALVYLLLVPAAALAAVRVVRSGAACAALFAAFSGAALLTRLLHGRVTGSWYVDYLGPVGSASAPVTHVPAGVAGLLHCLSHWHPVPAGLAFGISASCSALSVGFLTAALWRRRERGTSSWPKLAPLVWGALLAADGVLTYLGASDAHHNIALLAFSLAVWWYGETVTQAGPASADAPSLVPLAGLFLCSAFVGLTRLELLISPLVIPLLLAGPGPSLRDRRQAAAAAAAALGVCLAWLVVSYRGPWLQVASFGPSTWAQFFLYLYVQSPFSSELPPLLTQPYAGGCFLLFLLYAWRRPNRGLFGVALAYGLLILPKVMGGFGQARIYCCEDSNRYNVILIPVALLMDAVSIAWMAGQAAVWLRLDRDGRRAWLPVLLLLCLAAWPAKLTVDWMRRETLPLPHHAEFHFLSRSIPRLPQGATVVTVWVERLSDGRDADTQLAAPHALLVYTRPDLRWLALRPGDAIPSQRPFLYYKGASCSMDPAAGVTNGPDLAADREILAQASDLCGRLERRVSSWEARQSVPVRETTLHLKGKQLDLGLGWVKGGF